MSVFCIKCFDPIPDITNQNDENTHDHDHTHSWNSVCTHSYCNTCIGNMIRNGCTECFFCRNPNKFVVTNKSKQPVDMGRSKLGRY